jgi:hypothetical protein
MPNAALDSFVSALFSQVAPVGIMAGIAGSVLRRLEQRRGGGQIIRRGAGHGAQGRTRAPARKQGIRKQRLKAAG